jgi:hypothetical protein
MKATPLFTMVSAVVCLSLAPIACRPDHSKAEGVYTFRTDNVQEVLVLERDGRFIQNIKAGTDTFSSSGAWSLDGTSITFHDRFLVRFDTRLGRNIIPPEPYLAYGGFFELAKKRISFDVDGMERYFLVRSNR